MKTKKYAFVSASSRGLGLEIAKELSFDGYNVILTSRSKKNLKKASKELAPQLQHKIIKVDFSKKGAVKKLLKRLEGLNIEVLIHNYSVNIPHDGHPLDTKVVCKSIQNNFLLSLDINNAFVSHKSLKKIVYIGSTASIHAKASPAYTLSKSLINTYVKNSAMYYTDKGIEIYAVLPGILGHTGSQWDKKKISEPEKYYKVQKAQPLQRFIQPQEVAVYIRKLISVDQLLLSGSVVKLDANDY